MDIKKFYLPIILFILGLYVSVTCFNHVNSWFGVLLFILTLVLGFEYLLKKLKNND